MAMFTVYMDETGHHEDPSQKVYGMAGLINSVDNWDLLDRKWKEGLRKARVPRVGANPEPYFHMREFKASRETFETWWGQRLKQDKLYDKLLRIIESTHAVPLGSMITTEAWKNLTCEQQKRFLNDPYFFCAVECAFSVLRLTHGRPPEESVEVVFGGRQKVKQRIRRIFDEIRKWEEFKDRIGDPRFGEMRKFPALQAADVVAYEMNLEHRRQLYDPLAEPSEAWQRLIKQRERRVTGPNEILQFHSNNYVSSTAEHVEREIARRKKRLTTSDHP